MNIVRDRADVRWVPSRFQFAICRLGALLWLSRLPPQRVSGIILAIEPAQNAAETYAASMWILATTFAYALAFIAGTAPVAVALLAAFPLAVALLHVPLFALGVLLPGQRNNQTIVGAATLLMIGALSLWALLEASWIRCVGIAFFSIVGLNALAAMILILLRGVRERVEQRCAG